MVVRIRRFLQGLLDFQSIRENNLVKQKLSTELNVAEYCWKKACQEIGKR